MKEWRNDPWIERWSVGECRSLENTEPGPPDENGERWYSLTDGELTGFVVSTGNLYSETPEDYEVKFGPAYRRSAELLAEEFNRYEFQGPIPEEFYGRWKRLKRLAPALNRYSEFIPPCARIPTTPGKYLIHDYGVGWHPEDAFWLEDDLEAVEQAIGGPEAAVGSVLDLDTGEEVPFSVETQVSLGG